MLDYTLRTADELGMGVDMNLGTGWPFGGPQITPELAAKKLIITDIAKDSLNKNSPGFITTIKQKNNPNRVKTPPGI